MYFCFISVEIAPSSIHLFTTDFCHFVMPLEEIHTAGLFAHFSKLL